MVKPNKYYQVKPFKTHFIRNMKNVPFCFVVSKTKNKFCR